MIRNLVNGFCMALADSVPGVSGGTIAFVLGFYDAFIEALNNMFYGDKTQKLQSLKFLFKLGIGWIIGMILAVLALTELFETHIYDVSSLFLGFVIFSIPLIIKEELNNLKGKYFNLIFLVIGIVLVCLITYFNPTTGATSSVDLTHLDFGLIVYIFIAGMLAISAMVLPGISGSTILLILGLYMPVISGLKELLHLNFEYFPAIFTFGLGIIAGVFITIKVIKICLEKHRSATIYFVIGLMVGSLYAICMGPTTLKVPRPSLTFNTFNIITFIVGILIVVGLEVSKKYFKGNSIKNKNTK